MTTGICYPTPTLKAAMKVAQPHLTNSDKVKCGKMFGVWYVVVS